jgi:hypothetical protein
LQSGNSSAITTCDDIDIAVVSKINADRMIVPMFATSSGLRVTPDRENGNSQRSRTFSQKSLNRKVFIPAR